MIPRIRRSLPMEGLAARMKRAEDHVYTSQQMFEDALKDVGPETRLAWLHAALDAHIPDHADRVHALAQRLERKADLARGAVSGVAATREAGA
jgi:hypothetical protein